MTRATSGDDGPLGLVSILCFACEVGMLGLLAFAGYRIGGPVWVKVVAAIGLPVIAATVWAVWMAPKSDTQLTDPARMIAEVALFVAVGALVAVAGQRWWGAAFAAAAITVFALSRSFA